MFLNCVKWGAYVGNKSMLNQNLPFVLLYALIKKVDVLNDRLKLVNGIF